MAELVTRPKAISTVLAVVTLITVSCNGGETGATSTMPADAPTTSERAATTTIQPATTTINTALARHLERSGYVVSTDYVVETVVTGIDSGTGGLAIDADGFMYQGDFGYRRHPGDQVYRVDPSGNIEIYVESEEFGSLTMTTFGADGKLYQSSYGTDKVFVLEGEGEFTEIASDIAGPTGIVALEDGTVFVESYDRGIIHRIEPDGSGSEWVTHPGFNGPNGLTIGPEGTLFAVNHRDGGLFRIDQSGNVTELHRFPSATSHVVYLDGALFVTNRGAYLIYRYDLATGEVEIVAGNAEPGESDGRGVESSFGTPNAITVGPDGALYFNHGAGSANDPVTIRRLVYDP